MNAPKMDIAALCPACGGWVMLLAKGHETKTDMKDIGKLAAEGFTIKTIPNSDLRDGLVTMCECKREKKQQPKQPSLFEAVP